MPQAAAQATTSVAVSTESRAIHAVVAVFMQMIIAVVYSWSVFRGPLASLYGWSRTQTIAPYRYCLVVVAIGAILGGLWQDRKGSRLVATVGGLLLAGGSLLSALFGNSVEGLIIGYGIIGGLGGGFAYVTPIANLVQWFPDKRGMMVGLAVMGSGLSPLFWSPLIEALVGKDPTQFHHTIPLTFYVTAAIFIVAVVGPAQLFKVPPPGWKPAGWNPPPEAAHRAQVSSKRLFGTWQFYALWTIFFLGASVGLTAIGQASLLFQEAARAGAPISAGVAVGIMGVFNGAGRLGWGTVSDHFGRKFALLAMSTVSAIACLAFLRTATGFWQVIIGLCLAASAYGGYLALMPSLTADYYGHSSIGGNYGFVFSAWGVCGFLVPGYFEGLLDHARQQGNLAGGYSQLYVTLAALAVVGAVLAVTLRTPHLKRT